MIPADYPDYLLESFGELSKLLLSNETVGSTLDVVAHLAVQTIPGCDIASISLVKEKGISTLGSSDEIAIELDAIQYETGQGPCLDAIGKDAMWFHLDSMREDTLWPAFSKRAIDKGLEGLLAFTLKVDNETLGALNLYARRPRAFSEEDRETGAIYAAHAAIALANAQTHDKEARLRKDLGEALSAQEVIGRARGILMERDFRSADEALQILQARAEDLRKKISVAADQVIASSEREREELKLPEGFEDRVLSSTQAKRRRPRRTSTPWLVAATLFIALLIGGLVMSLQLAGARREAEAQGEALRAVLVNDNGALALSGTSGARAGLVTGDQGSIFVAVGLPEAPDGRTYQLWLLRSGEVVENQTFDIVDGVAFLDVSQPATSLDEGEVTLEPDGGSNAPTTEAILVSE